MSTQGEDVVDITEIDESTVERMSEARRVERAMNRTKRLLNSAAANDPSLRAKWELRLEREAKQLSLLCRA